MTRRLLPMAIALALVVQLTGLTERSVPVSHAEPVGETIDNSLNPVVVVLDTSGSMNETDPNGVKKIDGARSAVLKVVGALAPKSQFALIAYPGSGRVVNGCSIGNVEIPRGPLDQATTAAAVRRLSANGETPTGPALQHAADIIKHSPTQRGTVLLVSDGESNCGAESVCEVAKKLSAQGVTIQVNTVGFQINKAGAKELSCISDATGGRYADAKDKKQLEDALQDLSGARLSLDALVPDPLPVVSGTGTGGPKVLLTVVNEGRKMASDVRLSLDFRQSGRPGALLVPRPVRFLGNLEPGAKRSVEIAVRPDSAQRNQQFHWTAAVTATNAQAQLKEGDTSTAEPKLAGLLAGVKNIAVLGDSYSSGEGADDYDDDGTRCHRSAHAYGRALSVDTTLIACSGAVTAHFYTNQEQFRLPQLKQLRELALSDKSPEAVLLSIGGNDVGFSATVQKCFTTACASPGEKEFRATAMKRIAAIGDSLQRVYRDVNRSINDSKARAHRGGNYAPIIVVPYPRVVPLRPTATAADCFANINADEVNFFNTFLDTLNKQITAAAQVQRKNHVPIYVAADVIPAFQPDHTICDTDQYANTTTNAIGLWATGIAGKVTPVVSSDPGLLHPNKAGHAAMARAISTFVAGQTMMSDPSEVTFFSVDTKKPALPLSLRDMGLAGADLPADAGGYDPETTVVFQLDSTPRILGTATAGADGWVHTRVPLPVDIPPGRHHLRALGMGGDGMHEVVTPVRVLPPQTVGALITLLAGALAVGLGMIGTWRNRRQDKSAR